MCRARGWVHEGEDRFFFYHFVFVLVATPSPADRVGEGRHGDQALVHHKGVLLQNISCHR